MQKIWIILKSEFLRRVRTKWFIIITLLGPFFLLAITIIPAVVNVLTMKANTFDIAVVDDTGVLFSRIEEASSESLQLSQPSLPVDSIRAAVRSGKYDGYLFLPAELLDGKGTAVYYSLEGGGLGLPSRLDRLVEDAVRQHRLAQRDTAPEVMEILKAQIPLRTIKLTEDGEEADSSLMSSIVGYFMSFLIYIAVLLYGALVMQGVIEEKSSRVIEIMASSASPFELLMGKVLGVGAMGLVQMTVWGLMMLGVMLGAGSLLSLFLDPAALNLPQEASQQAVLEAADLSIPNFSPVLLVWFILFFLGGYLLYASLYAAIGSAVEQQQDAQTLVFPITILVIIPILFISVVADHPNAPISVALSLVPFFSPILMMVRITISEVPLWQVLLSCVLLAGGFVTTIWMSSRIYRVGILMYGKKPRLKDLVRWFRYA